MTFTPSKYQQGVYVWIQEGDGHAAVDAVAGSGKTTTIVEAAKLLNEPGVFCAFNKHIATELQRRLEGTAMEAMTIHSLGYRALRRNPLYSRARVNDRKYGDIVASLVEGATTRGKLDGKVVTPAQVRAMKAEWPVADLVRLCQLVRLHLRDPKSDDEVLWVCDHHGLDFAPVLYDLLPIFLRVMLREGKKMAVGEIDFTDMLYLPLKLKGKFPQYPWVFVDECQDLSRAQLEVVLRTVAPGGRVLAVGDPRQAIMGFAGAGNDSFERVVEGLKAALLPLSICYRCPTKVLDLARQYVPQIEARDDAPEGEVRDVPYGEIDEEVREGDMILCRITAPLLTLCYRLIAKGVKAGVVGRDIGAGLQKIAKHVQTQGTPYDRFQDGLAEWEHKEMTKLLKRRGDVDGAIMAVQDRAECLNVLYSVVEVPEDGDGYLTFFSMIERLFSDDRPAVTLSTVHRAKGLERQRVFILHPELMPHPMARSEWAKVQEENLMYVAYTRAMGSLFFVRGQGGGERSEDADTE